MFRKMSCFLSIALLLLALALPGCGKGEGPATSSSVLKEKATVKILVDAKKFSANRMAKTIPSNTSSLHIEVKSGNSAPTTRTVDMGQSSVQEFVVPFGNTTISVVARDYLGNILANKGSFKFLYPDEIWQPTIILEEPTNPPDKILSTEFLVNQVISTNFPMLISINSIEDQDGNPITNLTASNIEVWEDGQKAIVTDVSVSNKPLSMVIVIDRSGSMAGDPASDSDQAAGIIINSMNPQDQCAIMEFNTLESVLPSGYCPLETTPNILLSSPLTSNKGSLLAVIGNPMPVNGCTPLYDSIAESVTILSKIFDRKAVIILTDGLDTASEAMTLEEVIILAKQENTPVFTVGLGQYSIAGDRLSLISSETGGIHYYAPTSSDLNDIYLQISRVLENQIQLAFVSPHPFPDNSTREIEVRLVNYGDITNSAFSSYVY